MAFSATDSPQTQEALQKMFATNCLQKSINIAELSEFQTVLLIFSRHFLCNFCFETIAIISAQYLDLLKANIVPVFIHQETTSQANHYFENFPHPMAKYLLHCQDVNNYFVNAFQVKNVSLKMVNLANIKLHDKAAPTNHFDLHQLQLKTLPQHESKVKINKFRLPAIFVIQKCHIVKEFTVTTMFWKKVDFIKLVTIDLEELHRHSLQIETEEELEESNFECDAEMCFRKVGPHNLTSEQIKDSKNTQMTEYAPQYLKEPRAELPTSGGCFGSFQQSKSPTVTDVDLTTVMKHDKARRFLKYYFIKEHSVENIIFYETNCRFKAVKSVAKRNTLAKKIFDTFLNSETNSPMELNVSDRQRKAIKNEIDTNGGADAELFDKIVLELQGEVMEDTFIRFKETEEYKQMLRQCF